MIEGPFHCISEGEFTYFTIQMMRTHMSPHNKPEEPLLPISQIVDSSGRPEESHWGTISWDNYGSIAEPWAGSGNDYKPIFKTAHDETHDVWSKTGRHGWWTLKYAVLALKRMKKASEDGKMNWKDNCNRVTQAVRHDFRLVKVTVAKKVELVSADDLIDALTQEPALVQ